MARRPGRQRVSPFLQLGRDLRELIEYLDLHDVILVGHSMGGATITVMCSSSAVIESKKLLLLI